jgi:hypothetical protein
MTITRRQTLIGAAATVAAAALPAVAEADSELKYAHWEPWFAWHPVEVDAYDVSEIRDRKLRYTVVNQLVARKRGVETDFKTWKYRLTMPGPLVPHAWMPMTHYMIGDEVYARGRTYVATRNKASPPFFTERGWRRLEA